MNFNFAIRPDKQTNRRLQHLRNLSEEGELTDELSFARGVSLLADPDLRLGGTYKSSSENLLHIDAKMNGYGRWVGLHVQLPAKDLKRTGVVGFSSQGFSPEYTMLGCCLRSGTPSGFVDCFFDKHILLHKEDARHLDAISVVPRDDLPLEAPWRELVFFLPTEDFQITLTDLRVFVV